MTSSVAALVLRQAAVIVLDFDPRRPHYRTHPHTRRCQGRIPVGLHLHPAVAIHDRRINRSPQRKPFLSQRQATRPLIFARLPPPHLLSAEGSIAVAQAYFPDPT